MTATAESISLGLIQDQWQLLVARIALSFATLAGGTDTRMTNPDSERMRSRQALHVLRLKGQTRAGLCIADRRSNEAFVEAPCIGDLLDVGDWCCASMFMRSGLSRSRFRPLAICLYGQVVEAEHHVWLVEVERVWKGHEKLRHTVKLMDVYARMDCEFFFELGQRYLFFAVLAKGGRDVFITRKPVRTSRLQSTRVLAPGNESLWIEDLIVATWPGRTAPRRVGSLGAFPVSALRRLAGLLRVS